MKNTPFLGGRGGRTYFLIYGFWGRVMKEHVAKLDPPPYGFLGYSNFFLDYSFFDFSQFWSPGARDQGPEQFLWYANASNARCFLGAAED